MRMSDLVECQQRHEGGVCRVASDLAGRNVVPWDNVCETCSGCSVPQQVNYVTASIACYAWTRDADDPQMTKSLRMKFAEQRLFNVGSPPRDVIRLGEGPGTLLHDRLAGMGYDITPYCPCLYWIRQMNLHGSAWSREQANNIAAAMVTEFKRRYPLRAIGMIDPVLTVVSKRLIMRACREWDSQQATK